MSRCIDPKYENMIYAYELGMLSEKEQAEFELHLYECDHCFHKVQEFQPAVRQLRENKSVRAVVKELAEQDFVNEPERSTQSSQSRRWSFWPTFVPASLVIAVILIFLIVKPFRLEFAPTHEIIAAENSLLIMTFRNLVDPADNDKYGEIVSNLLITDLAESQYLQVVSYQRLTDLTNYIQRQDSTLSRAEMGQLIAEKTNSIWILTGNILQLTPQIIITSEIVDVVSGQILASQKVVGSENDDIFRLIDMLTDTILINLSIPDKTELENNLHIGEATTNSYDAYRHYIEGVEYYVQFYRQKARQSFHKALEYDSTFAMAYLYLSFLENRSYINQALQYSEHNPWKERHYIEANNYRLNGDTAASRQRLEEILLRYPFEKDIYYDLGVQAYRAGDYSTAAMKMKTAVEIDPLYKSALNILAYSYNNLGLLDSALMAIDKYIQVAPGEPNPYDSKGELLAKNGRNKDAIAAYKSALEINPEFINSLFNLGLLSIIDGDYEQARQCFITLASGDDFNLRSTGRLYQAFIPIYQGNFRAGLRILDDAIAANNLERETVRHASYNHVKAIIYTELEDWDNALTEIRQSMKLYSEQFPDQVVFNHCFYIYMLAASGDISSAEAEAEKLRVEIDEKSGYESDYRFARGAIEFYKENYEQALEYLIQDSLPETTLTYPAIFLKARTHLKISNNAGALEVLNNMIFGNINRRIYWGPWAVTPYYYRGLTYEKLGNKEKAIADYEKLIDLWKNADTEIPILDSAKQRLNLLKEKS